VIVDWANRSLDVPAVPGWLKAAALGNTNQFKTEFSIAPDAVVRLHQTEAASRNQAMTIVQVTYAARLANQLKQDILSRAGVSLQGAEFETVNDAVTQAKVTLTGLEQAADFWQLVETEDIATGQKQRRYVYYIMYKIEGPVWDQIVAKYLYDVVGNVPDSKGKQVIGGMFKELAADTRREQELTEAQFKAQVEAQRLAAERAHELEQARIKGQTAVAVAAATPPSQQAVYVSGDRAAVAAASTTAADIDWVQALSIAADVMF
jgi:hypothetical protein